MTTISELVEKDKMELPLLIKDCKNGTTSKGAPYLSLVFQDNSGTIDGKFWDVKPEDEEIAKVGQIVNVNFEVLLYNQNLQLRVNKLEPADASSYNIEDFAMAADESDEIRRSKINEFIESIHNDTYKTLIHGMLDKVGDKFFTYPAASKIHHSFLGGLSAHTISMLEVLEDIYKHYPQLDRDLLMSGALLHDIGKVAEMSGPITTEYTVEGRLEGHISIANGWLTEVAEEKGLSDKEETVLLHHMILSHHGHLEFGSPVLPQLQEAEVLCLIDNLDARLNTLKTALEQTKDGAWTQKLFALENRQFYKPKGEE